MSGYSKYPNQIDTSSELPVTVDLQTPVKGEVVNRLRDAILSMEQELGVNPSSEFGNVKDRLDSLRLLINNLNEQLSLLENGSIITEVNTSAISAVGNFCYISGSKIVSNAIATSITTSRVVGCVQSTLGPLGSFSSVGVMSANVETGITITAADTLFLSAVSSGKCTNVAPSAAGQVVMELGIALQNNGGPGLSVKMEFEPRQPIVIT